MLLGHEEAVQRFTRTDTIYATPYVKVYTAIDSQTSQNVAWKEVSCLSDDLSTIRKEFDLQSRLTHPAITKMIARFEKEAKTRTSVGMITELMQTDLEKELLRRRANSEYWSEEELVAMLGEIVSALAYCQRENVAHRDIKPANIFYSDGHIKVGDFGSSCQIDGTRSLSLHGTVIYLCPIKQNWYSNQQKQRYNPYKSDVFSLGVTMIQLATLKNWEEMQDFSEIRDLEQTIQRFVQEMQYGDRLKAIIMDMLRLDEESRMDFAQLEKVYQSYWGEVIITVCSACSKPLADSICLCRFPVLKLCQKCALAHSSATFNVPGHVKIAISEIGEFQCEKDVNDAKMATETIESVLKDVEEAEMAIKSLIKERKRIINQWKEDVEKEEKALTSQLEELISHIRKVQTQLNNLKVSELLQKQGAISRLKQIRAPYFRYQTAPRTEIHPLGRVEISEEITAISQWDAMIAFPMLGKGRMVMYRPDVAGKQEVRSLPAGVVIDDETSLALISPHTVAICGGPSSPRQLSFLRLASSLPLNTFSLSFSRLSPVLANFSSTVYVFGGKNERATEAFSQQSNDIRIVSAAQKERYRCSACTFMGKIYLPGQQIETYDPEIDQFTLFSTLRVIASFMSAAVVDDKLWVFTEKQIYMMNLRDQGEWRNFSVRIGEFWSRPGPVVQGECVLHFREDKEVVKLNVNSMLKKSFQIDN